VREGFLKLADERPDFVVIDSTRDPQTVHKQVVSAVQRLLEV
jgi:thymidylate kinase